MASLFLILAVLISLGITMLLVIFQMLRLLACVLVTLALLALVGVKPIRFFFSFATPS